MFSHVVISEIMSISLVDTRCVWSDHFTPSFGSDFTFYDYCHFPGSDQAVWAKGMAWYLAQKTVCLNTFHLLLHSFPAASWSPSFTDHSSFDFTAGDFLVSNMSIFLELFLPSPLSSKLWKVACLCSFGLCVEENLGKAVVVVSLYQEKEKQSAYSEVHTIKWISSKS